MLSLLVCCRPNCILKSVTAVLSTIKRKQKINEAKGCINNILLWTFPNIAGLCISVSSQLERMALISDEFLVLLYLYF